MDRVFYIVVWLGLFSMLLGFDVVCSNVKRIGIVVCGSFLAYF